MVSRFWSFLSVLSVAVAATVAGAPAAQAVTSDSAFVSLKTPKFTSASGNQVATIKGRIQPAAAGRTVSLYSVAADGSRTYVQGTTTDAQGRFTINPVVSVITKFRLFSARQQVGGDTYRPVGSKNFKIKSLRLSDGFNYTSKTTLKQRWALRGATFGNPGRWHTKASWKAASLNGKALVLSPKRAGSDPADGKPRYLVGHLTAGDFGVVRGHLEARIKFQKPRGAHGALWWQSGYGPGRGEFDVAEFFGKGSSTSQRIQHTIHPTDGGESFRGNSWTGGKSGKGALWNTTGLQRKNHDAWWTEYHTFEGFWNADKYTFSIDGKVVGSIGVDDGVTPASVPGEVILSLLVSEKPSRGKGEYAVLRKHLNNGGKLSDYKMYVDSVRMWR